MLTEGLMSSNRDDWATPQAFFDKLNKEFDFTLDPCASEITHKCDRYYTRETDGLTKSWEGERVFCNPPYGREIAKWVEKCHHEYTQGGCPLIVMLVPARTDTKWFHDYIYGQAELRFIKGRLHFDDGPQGAPFPSMVVIFSKAWDISKLP